MTTFQYNGHSYLLSSAGTWQEAQSNAQSLGGNLVTINDQAEQDWLISTFGSTQPLWIGYTDQETEGVFKWIDGETSTYTNWDTNQPDNHNGNEDFTTLGFNGSQKWNDLPNSLPGPASSGIVEIASINSTPTATALNTAETYTEDTALNLTDIIASDTDNATLTATLTLPNTVAGSLNTGTSNAVTSTYNASSGVWTANGASADVNTLLAGLSFTPATNFNDSFTLTTNISDGSSSVSGSKIFTGTAVNDAPTATALNTAEIYTEDTTLNLTDIVVSDIDSTTLTAILTLSNTAAGSLNTGSSNAVTSTYNAGTGVWTASGASADLNTLLAGLSFTPATNFNGTITLNTSISDGEATPVTGSKNFTGTAVNDTPTATALNTAETYTEDTSLNLTNIVANDVDGTSITATLTLSNPTAGSLNTDSSNTVTSSYYAGTGVWTASGASADVNALLAGLSFIPAANFNGDFTLATNISDGSLSVSSSKNFTGTAVNDLPTGAVTITGTATQGQSLTVGNTLTDVDGLGSISYQWQTGGVAIAGAISDTYTLTQSEVAKTIAVIASYTDKQNTAESVPSAATTAVLNINDQPTGNVIIAGTAKQGEVLTASNSLIDADGLWVVSYQWWANNIYVGTGNSYTLTSNEIGKTITATANYVDGFGKAESVTSDSSAVVIPPTTPGFTIIPATAQTTGEDSTIASYQIQLNTAPTVNQNVVITFASSDTSEGIIDNPKLSFTSANYSTPQTLTVRGVDDYLNDGNIAYQVTAKVSSIDIFYKNLTISPLNLTNIDDALDAPLDLYGDIGGSKSDNLTGGNGADTLQGLNMADNLSGGRSNDTLYGGYGNDNLFGNEGDDELNGEQGNDYLEGGTGNDSLDGGEGLDSMVGGEGNDTLDGGKGIDTMIGGEGNDTYYLGYDAIDVITDNGLVTDKDTVIMPYQLTSYTLPENIEVGTIAAGTQASNLTGNNSNNILTGNNGDNTLNGETGNDTLIGGNGSDYLEGGNGNDSVNGGIGNDIIVGGNGIGDDIYIGGAGIDTVKYTSAITGITVSLALGTASGKEIDNDQLNSIEDVSGGQAGDTLSGDNSNNLIDGFTGNDTISGNAGSDTLIGGSGNDQFTFNTETETGISAATRDRIVDFKHGQSDKIDLSAIDADTTFAGNNTFSAPTVGGTFSGTFANPGELYFDKTAHILYGNNDADSVADFSIQLTGVTRLVVADFVL